MALTKVGLKGLGDGTDGQVITYDANGNPVAVGPGTDGQVLTSTGAGSPPAFEDAAAGGAALTGSTNNTITTVTGSNAIQGEANLTFDGSQLVVTGTTSSDPLLVKGGTEANASIRLEGGSSSDDNSRIEAKYNLALVANADANIADREVKIYNGTTTLAEFKADGDVKINDGDLVVGTAGHGIDFSATSDASGHTSSLLDDYEEGDWTPADGGGIVPFATAVGKYIKIGNQVTCYFYIVVSANVTSTANAYVVGLPYTSANENASGQGASSQVVNRAESIFAGWKMDANSTLMNAFKNTLAQTNKAELWDGDVTNVSMWGYVQYKTA